MQYFPFDVQKCPITFGSWEYDSKNLILKQDDTPIITSDYKNSSEWDILYVLTENEVISNREEV